MEVEKFSGSKYSGTKGYAQHDALTAKATGLGSAAGDYMEQDIDLNAQLIRNKPATFFMKVSGESMINAGITKGDIVIVDRSINPVNGKIVIAIIDGEMLIRRYQRTFNKLFLVPETPKLATIEVNEFSGFAIWGVVTCVIRQM